MGRFTLSCLTIILAHFQELCSVPTHQLRYDYFCSRSRLALGTPLSEISQRQDNVDPYLSSTL